MEFSNLLLISVYYLSILIYTTNDSIEVHPAISFSQVSLESYLDDENRTFVFLYLKNNTKSANFDIPTYIFNDHITIEIRKSECKYTIFYPADEKSKNLQIKDEVDKLADDFEQKVENLNTNNEKIPFMTKLISEMAAVLRKHQVKEETHNCPKLNFSYAKKVYPWYSPDGKIKPPIPTIPQSEPIGNIFKFTLDEKIKHPNIIPINVYFYAIFNKKGFVRIIGSEEYPSKCYFSYSSKEVLDTVYNVINPKKTIQDDPKKTKNYFNIILYGSLSGGLLMVIIILFLIRNKIKTKRKHQKRRIVK